MLHLSPPGENRCFLDQGKGVEVCSCDWDLCRKETKPEGDQMHTDVSCRTDVILANQNFLPRVVNLENVNLSIWAKLFSRVVTWANLGGSKGGGRSETKRSRMEEGNILGK